MGVKNLYDNQTFLLFSYNKLILEMGDELITVDEIKIESKVTFLLVLK